MFKIIVFKDGARPTVQEVESPWNFAKQLLADDHDKDPTIQIVALDDGVEIFSDEDSLGKNLPLNRAVPATARELPEGFKMEDLIGGYPEWAAKPGELGFHHIHGNFILTRTNLRTGEPMSLTEGDIPKWLYTLWKQVPDPLESGD